MIYWSPLAFIETLLDCGANPNYPDRGGFPSLIAALSTDRPDRLELLRLLLSRGADTAQRGSNDWTPLLGYPSQRPVRESHRARDPRQPRNR
ncbi:hypothetical protein JQ597_13405 [Bradyrhizobium sp. AUGA SZCCT0177]|nr:hypothetical protein [Bradyrhizobium sp. AUGA SZCCT0177]